MVVSAMRHFAEDITIAANNVTLDWLGIKDLSRFRANNAWQEFDAHLTAGGAR